MPTLSPLAPILLRLASEPASSAPLNTSFIRYLLTLTFRQSRRPQHLQRAILYRTLSNTSSSKNSHDNDIMTTITEKPEKFGIKQWTGPKLVLFANHIKHPRILNLEDLSIIAINHVQSRDKIEWHLVSQPARQAVLHEFIASQLKRNTDVTHPQCKLVISSTSAKLLLAIEMKASSITLPDDPINIKQLIQELETIRIISSEEAEALSQNFCDINDDFTEPSFQ